VTAVNETYAIATEGVQQLHYPQDKSGYIGTHTNILFYITTAISIILGTELSVVLEFSFFGARGVVLGKLRTGRRFGRAIPRLEPELEGV
jgi:hypothetical protein